MGRIIQIVASFSFLLVCAKAGAYYGQSAYAYCNNNPVNFVDPDGTNWYAYDNHGETMYKYVEGQMSEDEIRSGGYIDKGFAFADNATNTYYSLFGQEVVLHSSSGKVTIDAFLYQHIDNQLIKAYSNGGDGTSHESFYSGLAPGLYGFSYNGVSFHSESGIRGGTIYWSVSSKNNSMLHIEKMPPQKARRLGGYNDSLSWNGCFLILSNDSDYQGVQINFDENNSKLFNKALVILLCQ